MTMLDWLRPKAPAAAVHSFIIETERGPLTVLLRRRGDARRMTLRMAPDGREARITMPSWGRIADARAFAAEKSDWLAKQMQSKGQADALLPGSRISFRGTALAINWLATNPRRVLLLADGLQIGGAAESIARRVKDWMRAEARRIIAIDLADYCNRAGRPVPALSLSSPSRRWGSCSSQGTIRINWRLIMAPDAVRRSVVAHEVAHLAHFNHSPAFHAELARLFEGDIKAANRWLKQNGRSLYLPFG